MHCEALGELGHGSGDALHHVLADARPDPLAELGRVVRDLAVLLLGRSVGGHRADLLEDRLQPDPELLRVLVGVVGRDVAATDERVDVDLAGRALGLDELVHQRLGEAGVVTLVMAALAVAHEVDDDVLGEPLAELERQARHSYARVRVVAVDVEDRCLDDLGHVGAIRGAA